MNRILINRPSHVSEYFVRRKIIVNRWKTEYFHLLAAGGRGVSFSLPPGNVNDCPLIPIRIVLFRGIIIDDGGTDKLINKIYFCNFSLTI